MIKLDDNEKIIKIFRKHWLVVVLELFPFLIAAIAPILLFFFFADTFFSDISLRNTYLLFLLYIFYLIFIWIIGNIIWLNYYLDIWILTDKRLIDVEQKSLFSREISSLRLEKIQDTKAVVAGVLNTFLHIGDVHVQTASAQKEFVIYKVDKPNMVKEFINKAHGVETEKAKKVKLEN